MKNKTTVKKYNGVCSYIYRRISCVNSSMINNRRQSFVSCLLLFNRVFLKHRDILHSALLREMPKIKPFWRFLAEFIVLP